MHEQSIIDDILSGIDLSECEVVKISLTSTPETLRERLNKDVEAGLREAEVIERSVIRLPLYDKLDTIKIVTDGRSIDEVAGEIALL